MRSGLFNEIEIIQMLKEVEGSYQVTEVRRERMIFDAAYNDWEGKRRGIDIANVRESKEFTDEVPHLK